MTKFNRYVAIKVNRWGKGLLGDHIQLEEYDHFYFGEPDYANPEDTVEHAYKVIDKLLKAGKREDITISLYESGQNVDTVRRLFVQMDYSYRAYGVAQVGRCNDRGCFDYRQPMDINAIRAEMRLVIDAVEFEQRRSLTA